MVEPIIEELIAELDSKARIYKLNVDQNPQLRQEYNIGGVPTFILFKDGRILKREVGARSKSQLLEMIKEVARDED